MLNERKKKILQLIIEDYISTAEPVGSRTIARKYDLGLSPATVYRRLRLIVFMLTRLLSRVL